MPRYLKTDADRLLPLLSPTPADQTDIMADLDWTLGWLEDAFYGVRSLGIRLDTRNARVRVLESSWPLCERRALEAYEA